MREKLKIDFHLLFPFVMTLFLWVIFYLNIRYKLDLNEYGVWPRSVRGLPGIIAHFFLHGNYKHIFSNTLSLLVLSLLLFLVYRDVAFKVFALLIPMTGAGLWLIGRQSEEGHAICHVGASGVIFALFGFLLLSGLIRKNKTSMALSGLVIFLYGYMVWGIFPTETKVSWEGHLAGLAAGLVLALVFRKKGPQPDHYPSLAEEEQEEETDPENAYWMQKEEEKQESPPPVQNNDVIFIRYNYLPKEKKDGEEENKD